ncbi:MAG TPA: cellulase family glycosylhydrolase [Opitutaceae bacterium]|jgi:hypothetical protein|nr:cellulase family glycosylhydrolase [Opitutaceae bacterium]
MHSPRRFPHPAPLAFFGWLIFAAGAWASVSPVSFVFDLPPDSRNPFAREVWAEVVTPSGKALRLPAFFAGNGQFAVRARANEAGEYRLGNITEINQGQTAALAAKVAGSDRVQIREIEDRSSVHGAAGLPARLAFASGATYTPIGANLAWAGADRGQFYPRAFREFAQAGLNWTRIWMVHWSGLNLDWLPGDMGKSPPPGTLDLRVAVAWDQIVRQAEEQGVYVQIVLQHHGQFSNGTDPAWQDHPWNAANGGFLHSPDEFFTSPVARGLTALKYRYIVARWGYSPAVLAWELFSEVHWVDAMNWHHQEDDVARWHSEMAAYLHTIDPYGHLVTTSTDNLRSPIYAAMDYFQPHLYPANVFAGVRQFDPMPAQLDRPVFYGEIGDDHEALTPGQKRSGVAIVPPIWASLMGKGRYPAQPWPGEQLIEQNRLGELGAVARFLTVTGLGNREGLTPFSAVVESAVRIPLRLMGGQVWQHRPSPEITVPLDGREPIEFAEVPQIMVGSPGSGANGFPDHAIYHFDFPRPVTLGIHVAGAGEGGAAIRVSVDGAVAIERSFPARPAGPGATIQPSTADLSLTVTAGQHVITVENSGGADWLEVSRIDLGLETSVLAAVGKRGEDFVTLWVWHRTGVFALPEPTPVSGTLVLDDVPAGTWTVTWWDTIKGLPGAPGVVRHPGGTLRLPTPPISRHAAVVLTR